MNAVESFVIDFCAKYPEHPSAWSYRHINRYNDRAKAIHQIAYRSIGLNGCA